MVSGIWVLSGNPVNYVIEGIFVGLDIESHTISIYERICLLKSREKSLVKYPVPSLMAGLTGQDMLV